ncbi:glycoside hydrolase family 3 N-terminal domain-containing protein [Tenacibaculum sp. UWU-22]|uniref:glycoside hydrolase family 3 N-terminal domain-containing protein n=1 Tax=Tenacibaculum sp. UWU-22 TaxID=3234187 RepID=UPI0034DB58FC
MQKKINILFLCFIISLQLLAQNIDPLRAKDVAAQNKWVDSILHSMTLDEKIGQLFMVQAYSNKDAKHEKFITDLITKYHVGNLIFMQGTPEKQLELTNKYQSISKLPLLIGFDGEWGLNMRLKNTYKFPWNMTLGAIRDNTLIEAFGKQVGKQCKRLGIHINFAPVVDINTNPKNPIIGNRSFGEDKENVTQKAIAFTKGMQSVGVLASAKHFPGHGDTATDSHHTLPVVNFTKQRLDTVELYPYPKLFDAGVASVMVAHLSVPSLEANAALPSSLSYSITTKLLQQKLGFLGLVITDGLNMKGAANYATSAAINLDALLAGNDLLLIPQDIPGTVALIKESLKKGMLTEQRINHSVKKILQAKYLVGLNAYKPIATENLENDLHSYENKILHRKLVKNSLTMLKNEKGNIPIRNLENKKIAYVSLGDADGSSFLQMLKNYAKVDKVSATNLNTLQKKLKRYNLVIVGFHKSNETPWKDYKFTDKELVWLQEIARTKNVILDVFASPYSLLQLKTFTNIEGILVSYQNSKISQELSAQAIFGAIDINGKLPVSIKNQFLKGHGLISLNLKRLQYDVVPEEMGMSSKKLSEITKYVDTIINEKMAPGVRILVARYGNVIYNKSFGYLTYANKEPVKNSDIYDLASVTKILASLPMIMKAEETHKISLNTTIGEMLPSFRNSNKDTVTVKEILSHVGKLKAWIPFYIKTQDSITHKNLKRFYRTKSSEEFGLKVARNMYLENSYKDSIYKYIKEAPQREYFGYKYSDLGYYLFKEALEQMYKKPYDVLVDQEFYKPLGAYRTTYNPLRKFSGKEVVPTEDDTYYRHQLLRGYVHDMGAAMLNGVSGHAGLFSDANGVAKIMQMYLQGGYYGGKQYLKPETIDKFNTRYYVDKKVRRALGFDKRQLDSEIKASCNCVSYKSFGHSGFTGTYTWADPESGILYVFLSNRVYPKMENRKLVTSNMRMKIQQVIQDAIIK